jgi:misacylated tRNA(Ala) deacylase
MTDLLFREDAYLTEAKGKVVAHTPEGGIVLDKSLFYATGGGQPGDSGEIAWDGGALKIATAVKTLDGEIALVPSEAARLPDIGSEITQYLDWDRRYRHMRIHTALHLLSVVIPLPVTGGSISVEKGRLDFDMPDAPGDKETIQAQLNELVARDLEVHESWITDDELAAKPDLVKTMSVKPPMGSGRVRLVGIGRDSDQIDLQPCGGTHVARTGEIGGLRIGKIEKKGKQNRRVNIHFED